MDERPDPDPQAVPISALVIVLPDGSRVPIRDLFVIVAPAALTLSAPPLVVAETADEHATRIMAEHERRKEERPPRPDGQEGRVWVAPGDELNVYPSPTAPATPRPAP